MSMFISKALRRAEVFLEQVDESVAQASRRLVVEGATSTVEEANDLPSSDEEVSSRRRASTIPRAEEHAQPPPTEPKADPGIGGEHLSGFEGEQLPEDEVEDAWGVDVDIDESAVGGAGDAGESVNGGVMSGERSEGGESVGDVPDISQNIVPEKATVGAVATTIRDPVAEGKSTAKEVEFSELPMMLDPMEAMASAAAAPPPALITPVRRFAPSTKKTTSGAQASPAADNEYVRALKTESTELRKELELVESDFEKSRRERGKLVKNLKRMKEIVSEMDESLREKSAEARAIEAELVVAKDEIASLRAKTRESDARGKDGMDLLRKELNAEIAMFQQELSAVTEDAETLREENERLKEALLHGNEVDLATADGARQEASQAHRAYEAETQAHRETRKQAKEREELLEAEAALATNALAAAQRKAEECTVATSNAKASQRVAETKLATVTNARNAAFARVEDLEEALRLYERGEGNEAPGQKEAKEMQETVSELENALEAKNVELNRLEGELESLRASLKGRRDLHSPRTPGQPTGSEAGNHQEVEVKLRHMADAALRKQAQLEVLRSENRALQHQLSTERKRTREAQAMAAAASSSRQTIRGGFRGILDTGNEDGDRVYGVRDGPLARFRTPRTWPRAISNAITGMDRFSAQALAFLRKEPLLRIVILFYLVAMHIFVYSLLHWHVDAVSGSTDVTHERIASAKAEEHMRRGM